MDFDGDGKLDMVSGSYDPGEIYLFRAKGDGTFAKRETLSDKNGKPILRVPDQTQTFESFGSWLAMVDWDADGDLDIILGGFDGQMYLRLNEGTRRKPAYAVKNIVIQAAGKDLKVKAHATPVVADWDGDGQWDLLSGSEDGGVYWWRNIGTPQKPEFAASVTLVAPHNGVGYGEFLDADEPFRPGIRSQIAVHDWDGDGKLDLLLGDFCTYIRPRGDLKPEERLRMLETRRKLDELAPKIKQVLEQQKKELAEFWKPIPKDDVLKPEVQKKFKVRIEELQNEPTTKRLNTEWKALEEELKPFLANPAIKSLSASNESSHGFVWVFRRR